MNLNDDPKVQELLSVLAKIEQETAQKKEDMRCYNESIKGLKAQARALRQEIQAERGILKVMTHKEVNNV